MAIGESGRSTGYASVYPSVEEANVCNLSHLEFQTFETRIMEGFAIMACSRSLTMG